MNLREEIKDYLDADGLVSPTKTSPGQHNASGNGLVYTILYYQYLTLAGDFKEDDARTLRNVLKSCEIESGLYKRSPVHGDQESIDDYTAITSMSGCRSFLIWEYGQKKTKFWGPLSLKYVYNNVHPGTFEKNAWLGRFLGWVGYLHIRGGFWCPPLYYLAYKVSLLLSARAPKKNQDTKMQTWLMLTGLEKNKQGLTEKYWWWKFNKDFPGGIGEVLGDYFGNLEHPLVKYTPK